MFTNKNKCNNNDRRKKRRQEERRRPAHRAFQESFRLFLHCGLFWKGGSHSEGR